MSESNNKNHRPLYPRAKTFDEIYAAKKQRELENRPRFVATKISVWATLGVVASLTTYSLLGSLTSNLSAMPSTGEVMFIVSSLIFIGVVGLAILLYLMSLIRALAGSVFVSRGLLYGSLALLALIALASLVVLSNYFQETLVLSLTAIAIYFCVAWIIVRLKFAKNKKV